MEGSNANCGKPLCCRASSGLVATTEDEAGYWGDYRKCDMPWRTLENAVKHMSKHHSVSQYIRSTRILMNLVVSLFHCSRTSLISYGLAILFHTTIGQQVEKKTCLYMKAYLIWLKNIFPTHQSIRHWEIMMLILSIRKSEIIAM